MDKGKEKMNESIGSDSSDSGSHIGSLMKPKKDYEALLKQKDEKIEYWKRAYLEQQKLYMDYSKWAKKGMDFMADKHRGQHHNMKNVMSKNRHYFSHLKQTLLGQFDDAFRQIIDFLFAMEWAAQDYMRDEHVSRFERAEEEESWMPSLFGRRVYASEANQPGGLIMDVPRQCRRPRVPDNEGKSRRRRKIVPPPSPPECISRMII